MLCVIGENIIKPIPEGATRNSSNIVKALLNTNIQLKILDISLLFRKNNIFSDSYIDLFRTIIAHSNTALRLSLSNTLKSCEAIYILNLTKEPFIYLSKGNKLFLHLFHSPESLEEGFFNIRRILFKIKLFNNINIITSSMRLSNYLKSKKLARNVYWVPTPIDVHVFKPIEKTLARKYTKLPKNKTIYLYVGSIHPRRGVSNIIRMLRYIDKDSLVYMLIPPRLKGFTGVWTKKFLNIIKKINNLYNDIKVIVDLSIKTDYELALLYNAADLVIMPFERRGYYVDPPSALLEALSCGSPVLTLYELMEPGIEIIHNKKLDNLTKLIPGARIVVANTKVFHSSHSIEGVAKLLQNILQS